MGFKKADEMEMSIQLKAVRWAWLYTVIFLGVWAVYDKITTGDGGLPFILLLSQNVVLSSLVLYYRHKMTKINPGEDDEK